MELLNYYPKPKYLIIGSFKGPLGFSARFQAALAPREEERKARPAVSKMKAGGIGEFPKIRGALGFL